MPNKTGKWARISAARRLLGLAETASLEEIREAYRRKAKAHHPDTAGAGQAPQLDMHLLTEAYQTLNTYCHGYRIPLEPGNDEVDDDEDWWMKRFGNDPLWGKARE